MNSLYITLCKIPLIIDRIFLVSQFKIIPFITTDTYLFYFLTLIKSFLSSRRAQIQTTTYNTRIIPTVQKTGMASRKFSRLNTVLKSMVLGGTAKSPPKRCQVVTQTLSPVHRSRVPNLDSFLRIEN